jgi:hypothetical protein
MHDELSVNDYMIICGDFAIVWEGGNNDDFRRDAYKDFPCTILWVDGNHENFTALYQYPVGKWRGGKVHFIDDKIYHLMRGEVFDLGGLKFFAFGGAKSTDRGYDTGINAFWWEQELPTLEEMQFARDNLKKHNNIVDYIITHTAPRRVLREYFRIHRDSDATFDGFLDEIAETVDFKGWYFGHCHDDETKGKYNLVYNSIHEIKCVQ